MGRMIAIDLGTTNCCAAFMDGDEAKVIPMRDGDALLPSVAAVTQDHALLIGRVAQRQAIENPRGTVFAIKRLIGRKHDAPELEGFRRVTPYEIVPSKNGDAWVRLWGKAHSPEEISALYLREIHRAAEAYLGEPVSAAVVTVPAYFNDNQRHATKNAGAIAGLRIAHILNEPTAAAIGYGLSAAGTRTLAVVDLGGGTFDVTILHRDGDVFEVLSTSGDTFLGGDDFDVRIMGAVVEDCLLRFEVDLTADAVAMQRLKETAERAKRALSSAETTSMNLPFLSTGPKGPINLSYETFSRRSFEAATVDLIDRLEAPCRAALRDAALKPAHIEEVLLVGGMSRMPSVQRKIAEIFGANKIRRDADPEQIIALGAAIQCGILSGTIEGVSLLDVTPHSLGVRVFDGRMSVVIPRNSGIPTIERKTFATTKDYQKAVTIEVFQGEDGMAAKNVCLGSFELGPLPPALAGQVQVEVTFATDADGVLNVTAREKQSQREASVTITPSGGLSIEQVQDLQRAQAARHTPSLAVRAPQR